VAERLPTQEEGLHPAPLSPTKSRGSNPPASANGGISPASTHSPTFDPVIAEDAQLADMYQEAKQVLAKPVSTNKVMTPAQWEQYKKQKEMDSRIGALSDSESDVGDHSSDDDELERGRQAAAQRRKQEAHLAVYRQKMMKVTGETDQARAGSAIGFIRAGAGSAPELNRMSRLTLDSKQSGKSSGDDDADEDEDVPLGILAAHGFPNKNRPPTRLANSGSNSNLRGLNQAQGAPSVRASGNLPAFARQLPADPYYGAGIVNPPNREQLAMHVPQGAGSSTPHPVHPAGLVGVIAGEERARAARRGSPNASGGYEMPPLPPHPGMVRSSTAGALPLYPPGMPPMMTPGDHAQIQMANQMNQMMQMQMQWMQQMAQTMGGGQFNPGQMMPQFPGQPQAPQSPGSRPQSAHMQGSAPFQPGQRTMSMTPGMNPWGNGQPMLPSINVNGNYAPSIAPSERSNIGLASRYRPVSTIAADPEPMHRRASTFTSASVRPWSQMNPVARAPTHAQKSSVNTLGRRSPLAIQDDEDDEEGWAEMKQKKEKKQKGWALRKGQNALQELYNPASAS
jgi:hypothetical protein